MCVCISLCITVVHSTAQNSSDLASYPPDDLLRKLHWLPVQSRIEFKIACITYKVLSTGQPTYLSTLLNHYTPLCTLRSANQYRLQHTRVSTEFVKRSFSCLAPKIWNNIPLDIRLCSTLPTFKRHLKAYLFK